MKITISAAQLDSSSQGVDYNSFLATYFEGLTGGTSSFYGGEPDTFFGQTYYMNGDEIGFDFDTADGAASNVTPLMVGEDLAYDFIHYGAAYGHGISGSVTGLEFGYWTDETTAGEDGHGLIEGLDTVLDISGLDLFAAAGSGSDPATNEVYALYQALQTGDYEYIYSLLGEHRQLFVGSDGGDRYRGTEFADKIKGGDGDDILHGGGGADRMHGGDGDDALRGGAGNDTLRGGRGDDTLKGGGGKNVFEFAGDAGDDVLLDFNAAKDTIDLSRYAKADADISVADVDGSSVVTVTTDDYTASITVLGVTGIQIDDFLV